MSPLPAPELAGAPLFQDSGLHFHEAGAESALAGAGVIAGARALVTLAQALDKYQLRSKDRLPGERSP
jgi:hypothetical protein